MSDEAKMKKTRRRRIAAWSLAAILVLSLAAPFSGLLLPAAVAGEEVAANPRAEYWREVRDAGEGYSAVSGGESGVLINDSGQNWRRIRNGWVANIMPWVLLGAIAALVLYHLACGQNKVAEPLSGRKVLRWLPHERILHFMMAGLFIVLAITGLSLLFGRALLIPVIGKDAFAAYADVAKDLHNYLGPAFAVVLAVVVVMWMRHNIFNEHDREWLRRWGGLLGKGGHPHAGRMNGGEKMWFWIITIVGGMVCISGFILDFPNFEQTRGAMQTANIIHGVLGVGWIAVALGHIYIGTMGTEGALEGMTTGYVSEEWARQHHDLWLDEVKQEEKSTTSSEQMQNSRQS